MQPVSESQNFTNMTATTTVRTGAGGLLGLWVSSVSATPTIKVQDGSVTIVNTFTPTSSAFYPIPARFVTSLVITIGGTVDCTAFWN